MPSLRSFAAAASPFFESRDPRMTTMPSLPSSRAVSKPRPRLAPVMKATLPFGFSLLICSFHLLFRSIRSEVQNTELLHQREKISHAPMVGDFAVADAHHVDSLEVNFAVSWSDAEEISFMRSVVSFVSGYGVAIGELPMHLWVKVGEGLTHIAV